MGISLDFTTVPAATPASNGRRPFANQASDKPKSQVWMNVGYQVGDTFISLPLGQGIDTMDAAEIRGQNEDFAKKLTAQNGLLKILQTKGAELAPGETTIVNLTVQLRRVNAPVDVSKTVNEYAIDVGSLFAAPVEKELVG